MQPATTALLCRSRCHRCNAMSTDHQVVSMYACRCLNIRISTIVSSSERPNYPSDSNYFSVFVDDDGIQVVRCFLLWCFSSRFNLSAESSTSNSPTLVKASSRPWYLKALSVYLAYMLILRTVRLSRPSRNISRR